MRKLVCAGLLIAATAAPEVRVGAQSPGTGHVLVSLSGEDRVVRVDPASGRILASFPSPRSPHEIAVSHDGRFAYAANTGAGPDARAGESVTAIDLRSGASRPLSVSPDGQPHDVRVSRDGKRLWVAVAPSRAVIESNASDGRRLRSFDTQRDGGWFVVATPDDSKLYVPLLEGKGVTAIDLSTGASRVILSGSAFSGADVSPDGREVWAVEHEAKRIHVLSTRSDAAVATVPLESAEFGRVRFTPAGRRLLLVQGARVSVIDVPARAVSAVIDLPFPGKVIAVASDGRRAAVSHPVEGRISVLDLDRLLVSAVIAVGRTPDGVAWIR